MDFKTEYDILLTLRSTEENTIFYLLRKGFGRTRSSIECAIILFVTRCNISFGARGFRSAAFAIWNSLLSNVRCCETLTTFRRHLKSHLFHSTFATA